MADGLLTGISQQASDVAKATGVAYSDVGKVDSPPTWASLNDGSMNQNLSDNAKVATGSSFVDPDKSTVKGQLSSLLASNSPYIQQAQNASERASARRGMLNTSMAIGAGTGEAIKAALPIAQQDATTYAQAGNLQQQATNAQNQVKTEAIVSSELSKQNADIKQTQQNIQNQFTAQMAGADEQTKAYLQDFQQQNQAFQADLDRQHQNLVQNQQISADKATSIRTQASNIMQNYQISVENLMKDPDFLNLGAAALQNTVSQLQILASNSINFVGASSGIDLTGFVDSYLKPITMTK